MRPKTWDNDFSRKKDLNQSCLTLIARTKGASISLNGQKHCKNTLYLQKLYLYDFCKAFASSLLKLLVQKILSFLIVCVEKRLKLLFKSMFFP